MYKGAELVLFRNGEAGLKETSVAELRKHTKYYFDAVEQGDIIRVYRKGRPVAQIVPIPGTEPSWKREISRLTIPGLSLSREILRDRMESES
jgi:antitoxin (DNA-binding transcriptional repressor) of toxin-antitoxin stability system